MSNKELLTIRTKLYNLQPLTVQEESAIISDNLTWFDCVKWIRVNLLIKESGQHIKPYLELVLSELSNYYKIQYPLKKLEIISLWLCTEQNIYFPLNHNDLNEQDDILFFSATTLNMKLMERLDPQTDIKRILALSAELVPYLDRYYKIKEKFDS